MLKKAALLTVASGFLATTTPVLADDAFTFVALGDLPYGAPEAVYGKYESLIAEINDAEPDFSIHIGDIKSGGTQCTDEEFQNQKDFLNSFDTALIYTPGDNEWTDCYRKSNGPFEPLERLAKLREMFWTSDQSLGENPLTVERQPTVSDHDLYTENARFTHNDVMFITAHIVGSNNNFEVRELSAVEEYMARDVANVDWINTSFDKAMADDVNAIVFAIHANPLRDGGQSGMLNRASGFRNTMNAFLAKAEAFGKPILFVHGDSHIFRIDRPFLSSDDKMLKNVTRLEVFGASNMHAVEVSVDPESVGVFGFTPIYNPEG